MLGISYVIVAMELLQIRKHGLKFLWQAQMCKMAFLAYFCYYTRLQHYNNRYLFNSITYQALIWMRRKLNILNNRYV